MNGGRCSACDDSLSTWYFERGGLLFCREDYWARYGDSCHQCAQVGNKLHSMIHSFIKIAAKNIIEVCLIVRCERNGDYGHLQVVKRRIMIYPMMCPGDDGPGDVGGAAPLPPRVLRVRRVRRAHRGRGALRAARALQPILVTLNTRLLLIITCRNK